MRVIIIIFSSELDQQSSCLELCSLGPRLSPLKEECVSLGPRLGIVYVIAATYCAEVLHM